MSVYRTIGPLVNFVLIVPYPQAITFAFIYIISKSKHEQRSTLVTCSPSRTSCLLGAQAALVLFHRRRNRRADLVGCALGYQLKGGFSMGITTDY